MDYDQGHFFLLGYSRKRNLVEPKFVFRMCQVVNIPAVNK